MKDTAHQLSFLAICGIVAILLPVADYAIDVYSVLTEKARAYDERMHDEAVIATTHGMILPVEGK